MCEHVCVRARAYLPTKKCLSQHLGYIIHLRVQYFTMSQLFTLSPLFFQIHTWQRANGVPTVMLHFFRLYALVLLLLQHKPEPPWRLERGRITRGEVEARVWVKMLTWAVLTLYILLFNSGPKKLPECERAPTVTD